MKKYFFIFIMVVMLGQVGFSQTNNPFFMEWNTPFQVPPFEQIKNEHYMPAFTEAMARQKKEIEEIIRNTDVPTFENTVAALDQSGSFLDKVSSVFYGLNAANTDPEMQEIAKKLSPLLTGHGDDINLNPALFAKVSEVFAKKDKLGLDSTQVRLVEEMYKDFVRGGANLDEKSKKRLRDLNTEINMLQLTFGQNLLAETNAYRLVVEKKEDLSGLPEGTILTASEAANKVDSTKGKWVFGLQNPSVMPFLQYADNRKLREVIFKAYINRGNNGNANDNKEVIGKLIKLRSEKARLMGYKDFASFVLENRMAKNPANVNKLLEQIWSPALKKAKEEAAGLQAIMKKDASEAQLQGWDWRYYSEKEKKQRFGLEEETLKPYFQLDHVRQGVFYVANRLYGISFTEVQNAPVYYSGVKLFECKDADGSHLGVLYLDFHPRQGKRGGAWCGSYRSQTYKDNQRVAPVMTIVCNFSAPTAETPALLTADETETFFHEFGHALQVY
jgi:peptidyl-dipeptidase Dcp